MIEGAPANVLDFGAVGDGVANDTAAIQAALNTGITNILFPPGAYKCANLTMTTAFQKLYGSGNISLIKNANGPILTASGADQEFHNISFRGDAASPTFTGDNLVLTGARPKVVMCGSRWASGRALKATGSNGLILGTNDIYQTADATATGYDIEIGQSGVATLYWRLTNLQSTQSTGGYLFIDSGSQLVTGCELGKYTIQAGTSPAGVNGGNMQGCRVTGNITVGISNSVFSSTGVGAGTISFAAGTSGHSFSESNIIAAGVTLTDSSTNSYIVDSRDTPWQSYTPVWTTSGAAPSIGNGSIVGKWNKIARDTLVYVRMDFGSTTNFGTGAWTLTLPKVSADQMFGSGAADVAGTFYLISPRSASSGATCVLFADNATNNVTQLIPGTWASGGFLEFTLRYMSV